MDFIAHKDEDREQLLIDHLVNTANLSRDFSVSVIKEIAWWCGYYHDIGKYSSEFQKRIRGADIRVPHADCGAYEINNKSNNVIKFLMMYCIAGHHTGLQDGGSNVDDETKATLKSMLNAHHCDYSGFSKEVKAFDVDFGNFIGYLQKYSIIQNKPNQEELVELIAFFTKYVFSCLTDADYIDTESFFDGSVSRGGDADFKAALSALDNYMDKFKNDTKVKNARKNLQSQAYKNFDGSADIHVLNMPTGSGKTLCSIKIALETAIKLNKKRIIYVIPYTAVIEQTAKQFNDIFGEYVPILEHHSNYDYDSNDDSEADKLKKSSENWDYPMIITTNIQFFQSVYDYRSSKLRKLHNMGDAVIVFDEIHMLPLEYLKPCFRAIGYICRHLNSQCILLSATMPDYSEFFDKYLNKNKVDYLIKDKSDFSVFEKCVYKKLGLCDVDEIIEMSEKHGNALIIVNTRKRAREVYDKLTGVKYHLSTYMTPKHRKRVIDEIKNALKNNEKISVVSTSLIEVGVDLDFESVFRELAGLDNIIQSAGRCNREGRLDAGSVYVFELEDSGKSSYGTNANIAGKMFDEYDNIMDNACIEDYYKRLIFNRADAIDNNTIAKGVKNIESIPFRSYAEKFKLIENETFGVVIPNDSNRDIIKELDGGRLSVKRRLQGDMASVKLYELKNLIEQGAVAEHSGTAVLENPDYYDDDLGLLMEIDKMYIF